MSEEKKEPELSESEKALFEFANRANELVDEILTEAYVAGVQQGSLHSLHEGIGWLDHFMHGIRLRVYQAPSMRDMVLLEKDALGLAAVCLRMIMDCCRRGNNLNHSKEA